MTELHKGQRVRVDATVTSTHVGDVDTVTVRVVDDDGFSIAMIVGKDVVHVSHPTYLTRREAMVRAIITNEELSDRLAQGAVRQGYSVKMGIVGGADEMLRAIDETPVPEWAGGEHE